MVAGVLLWLVNNYMPVDHKIKMILNIVVVGAVVVWLLSVFGLMDSIRGVRVGR
ncbi:MAG: Thivi_2564 family membrane protein [Prochlorococcaceae cyanobacterium]